MRLWRGFSRRWGRWVLWPSRIRWRPQSWYQLRRSVLLLLKNCCSPKFCEAFRFDWKSDAFQKLLESMGSQHLNKYRSPSYQTSAIRVSARGFTTGYFSKFPLHPRSSGNSLSSSRSLAWARLFSSSNITNDKIGILWSTKCLFFFYFFLFQHGLAPKVLLSRE